jgi:Domain of unknown function (DUF6089)
MYSSILAAMFQVQRVVLIFFLCCNTLSSVQAQSYYTVTEYGISMGCSQYFGDLNNNYGFKTINPAYGVYLRYHLNQFIAVKVVTNFTHVNYDDRYNNNPYEQARNLNFASDIYEGILQAEFNFFRFATGDPENRFTPYLTGGIGLFYFNSYTNYQGQQYYLQNMGTEGQYNGYPGRKYGNTVPCFPIGAGIKFWLRGGVNLSIEIADRLTTTTYLDDVGSTYVGVDKFPKGSVAAALQDRSVEIPGATALGRAGKQRGNDYRKDQYLVGLVGFSWHFKTYKCPASLNDDMIRVRGRYR